MKAMRLRGMVRGGVDSSRFVGAEPCVAAGVRGPVRRRPLSSRATTFLKEEASGLSLMSSPPWSPPPPPPSGMLMDNNGKALSSPRPPSPPSDGLNNGSSPSSSSSSSSSTSSSTTTTTSSLRARASLSRPLTFHRKPLPGHLASFTSVRGRRLFAEAMRLGGLKTYFPLAECYETQSDPAFCGVGTLSMCLNALGMDPGRRWKGVWRWYTDAMVECCVKLDKIEREGMSFEEFARLGRCHGLVVDTARADRATVEDFRAAVRAACVCDDCGDDHDHAALGTRVLVASYSRPALGQTGDGHFSPIAAYAPEADEVLILDVARFKYPPHWVPLAQLWEAMSVVNPWSCRSRGYFNLACFPKPEKDEDRCPDKLRFWAATCPEDHPPRRDAPQNSSNCTSGNHQAPCAAGPACQKG